MTTTTIGIPELGPLRPDPRSPGRMTSEPVPVPLLDGAPLAFDVYGLAGDAAPGDFADTVRAFLALSPRDRAQATPRVHRCYRAVDQAVDGGVDMEPVRDPQAIWRHVHPIHVFVERTRPDGPVWVVVGCDCDWEPEHGLKLVYRGGRELARVSAYDSSMEGPDGDVGLEEDA